MTGSFHCDMHLGVEIETVILEEAKLFGGA